MPTLPGGGRPRRPSSSRRPALEVLEGRCLLAAPAPVSPLAPSSGDNDAVVTLLLQDRAPSAAAAVQPLPTAAIADGLTQPAASAFRLAVAALAPATPLPVIDPPLDPLLPADPPLIDRSAFGFQGQLLFPGTGLQVRTATVSGPMTQQPPGVFAVGGGGSQSDDRGAEAPQAGDAGAESAPDDAAWLDLLFSAPP